MAAGVINQSWSFYVPFFDVNFTSWRLFICLGALPGLLAALAFLYLPESPKYLFSKGRTNEANKVIKRVYSLDQEISNEQVDKKESVPFLKSLWDQASPLFKRRHLKTTIIVCLLEFVGMYSAFGIRLSFPDIVNSVIEHVKDGRESASLCEIYGSNFAGNKTEFKCVESFDISTYKYSIILESTYLLGYLIIFFLSRNISNNNLISEYRHVTFKYLNNSDFP